MFDQRHYNYRCEIEVCSKNHSKRYEIVAESGHYACTEATEKFEDEFNESYSSVQIISCERI